jgi:hypothetical protein
MLDVADIRRRLKANSHHEKIDPALRFECWTVKEAAIITMHCEELTAGYYAGLHGEPCPGPARCDAFRLGWEIGATTAKRVPIPAWLVALAEQASFNCVGSA